MSSLSEMTDKNIELLFNDVQFFLDAPVMIYLWPGQSLSDVTTYILGEKF